MVATRVGPVTQATTTEPSTDGGGTVTGGIAMARQLATEGVTHIFGIPGVQLDDASNGLARYAEEITFINARHEQTTTYAADGYARSTGRIGVALVVPGPGVLNAGSGLVTALSCSSPVLLISGQIPTRGIGQGLGLLHEIPDQSGLLATLCVESTLVTEPGQVPGALHGAMVRLAQGPGPVAVEIPPDVLAATTDGAAIGPESPGSPPAGDEADLGAAAEAIMAAERPVIYVGGGAYAADAWDELGELAATLSAPIVSSANGIGSFDNRHPMSFLPLAAKELLARADLVLFIGSRALEGNGRPLRAAEGATLVSINRDPAAFGPPRDFDVTVTGDARTATAALRALVAERGPWLDDADDVRARVAEQLAPLEPQLSYAAALRDAMPDDAVLVSELTQVGYVGRYTIPIHHPRSYLSPGYQGTLGYGYPTAIGAAVGCPDRPVVSINGDGGFGYGLAEMATVMNYGIPLIGIVFRDDAYGNVQRMHKQKFDGVHHGTELTNPDLGKLAAAFDMTGYRADDPDELRSVLSRAIDAREPCLIDVPIGVVPDPWAIVMRPYRG